MGTQLMNSILYISEYIIQLQSENSVNYKNKFPCGKYLEKTFMYINLFWTLMPLIF